MDTASFQFVFFGLAVAILSNLKRSPRWRSTILMLASLAFLGLTAHRPAAMLPLIGFLALGYACLVLLERGWQRATAWSVVAVVLVYVWLKKYTFLPYASFLHMPYFTLGLSYIFFRVLHLLIEAGEAGENRRVGLGAYLLYTLNFTTFISGPIQRYDEFVRDQFAAQPIRLGPRTIGLQLERIVRGFFKANVLAMVLDAARIDSLAEMSQPIPASLKLFAAFRLAVLYPLFLYANFSGYIDIVIGLARLMRLRLPENFDRPFSTSCVLDFWNKWHMTLSNWLKTYVYNPLLLALMRRISSPAIEPLLGVFCFFVTFFLIGVWHGRTSEFIFFGLLTGGGMSINKLWQLGMTRALGRKRYRELGKNSIYTGLGRGLNYAWFAFTLFWFWGDWKQIDFIFSTLSVIEWVEIWLAVWLASAAILGIWEWLRGALLSLTAGGEPVLTSRYLRVVYASTLCLVAVVITVLLSQPAPDIVYKAF